MLPHSAALSSSVPPAVWCPDWLGCEGYGEWVWQMEWWNSQPGGAAKLHPLPLRVPGSPRRPGPVWPPPQVQHLISGERVAQACFAYGMTHCSPWWMCTYNGERKMLIWDWCVCVCMCIWMCVGGVSVCVRVPTDSHVHLHDTGKVVLLSLLLLLLILLPLTLEKARDLQEQISIG